MRVLMITMQYPAGPGQSYLTTELADALSGAGHDVEVLHLDWNASPSKPVDEFRTLSGVRVIRCAARYVSGFGSLIHAASKFVLSGRRAARIAQRHFDLSSFDAAIAWMPATAISPLVRQIVRCGIRHRIMFIWDFFPDHHHEIGRIPGGPMLWIARAWERRLLRHFNSIICTLPANADYLRRNFPVRQDQRVLVTPIWGNASPAKPIDRAAVRKRYVLPLDAPIAVFGGQLVKGRGFDQMLDAAHAASAHDSSLVFLFVGDGSMATEIQHRAATRPNVVYHPSVTRDEYLELLGACDVGMVATVPKVSSFSFPSKTIDYLRAGLPIIAAVEHGSDFIAILENYGVGAAVPFGEPMAFYAEAERLARGDSVNEGAARCLDEIFDVRHAVATISEAIGGTGAMRRPRTMQSLPRRRRRQSEARELRRFQSGRRSTPP